MREREEDARKLTASLAERQKLENKLKYRFVIAFARPVPCCFSSLFMVSITIYLPRRSEIDRDDFKLDLVQVRKKAIHLQTQLTYEIHHFVMPRLKVVVWNWLLIVFLFQRF